MNKIDKYITDNYGKFTKMIKIHFPKYKKHYPHLTNKDVEEYSVDIISYLWETMTEKTELFNTMPENEMDKWSYKFIHSTIKYTRSKLNFVKSEQKLLLYDESLMQNTIDKNNLIYHDINIETFSFISDDAPKNIKNYIKYCISSKLNDEQIIKLIIINFAKQEMHISEQAIFEMYYEQGMSIRDINKHTKVGMQFICNVRKKVDDFMKNRVKVILEEYND